MACVQIPNFAQIFSFFFLMKVHILELGGTFSQELILHPPPTASTGDCLAIPENILGCHLGDVCYWHRVGKRPRTLRNFLGARGSPHNKEWSSQMVKSAQLRNSAEGAQLYNFLSHHNVN